MVGWYSGNVTLGASDLFFSSCCGESSVTGVGELKLFKVLHVMLHVMIKTTRRRAMKKLLLKMFLWMVGQRNIFKNSRTSA